MQGAIGDKDYSGFFFQPENSYSGSTSTPYYHFTYALADINDPVNGIVVDPTTTGGTLLAPRRASGVVSTDYFLIQASTSNTTLYVLIYNGKVYGTTDIAQATEFEAYQLANADHYAECVQEAVPATCEKGGVKAKYHCTICDKYFREEACTNETSSENEEIPALGHDYQVVKDEQDNALWTWINDYSKATLHVRCSRSNCYATDDQTVATTSEVTTVPTAEAEGVLTYTAKVTYNEVEYTGTKTETLEKTTELAANTQLTDGSWTLYNADAGSNTADITVTPGTSSAPTVANILLQSASETPITVQTSIIATDYTTVNIHTIGNVASIIKGNLTANQYGTLNINGASVSGKIDGNGTIKMDNANVTGYLDLSYGANVTINGGSVDASSCEVPAITANDADVNISGGSFKAKEGKPAFLKSGNGDITAAKGKTFWHDGVAYDDPFAAITPNNAPARGNGPRKAPVDDPTYSSQLSSYTICDATHTDANFAGQRPFGSSELTGVYVCDNGCGTTQVPATPTYTRTMSNEWGTIVLPFDVTIDSENQNFDFYTVSSVSSTELSLTKMTGTLAAGTPALIRMSEAAKNATGIYVLSLTAPSNSVSTTITNPTAVGGLTLTGTYAVAEVTNGYIIGNDAFHNAATLKSNDALWKDSQGNTIAAADRHVYCQPFRAYLAGTLSNQNGAPARLTIGTGSDDETTALEAIEAITEGDATGTEPVEYFDMNGHRIDDLQQGSTS